jgi:hypothetical protein
MTETFNPCQKHSLNIVNTASCVVKDVEFIFCLYKECGLEMW